MAANQMKHRMQSLGLLDRSFKAATDDELTAAIEALGDEHLEAIEQFVEGDIEPDSLRAGVKAGRIDGGMEAIAAVITDACLADCIERLGDHADNQSSDQLREVLPLGSDINVGEGSSVGGEGEGAVHSVHGHGVDFSKPVENELLRCGWGVINSPADEVRLPIFVLSGGVVACDLAFEVLGGDFVVGELLRGQGGLVVVGEDRVGYAISAG